jgi:S-adenosylmethionine uptake transporter
MQTAARPRHPTETAMLLMAAAMAMLPAMDSIAKALAAALSPGQIAWARFAFQLVFLAPLAVGRRWPLAARELPLHLVRGVLIAVATTCFFTALTVLPLADTLAIFFVEPLLLSLLAGVFLREGIGWRRIAAILVGFAGAMLIVRPSFGVFGVYALLPLVSGTCIAVYLLLTRSLGARSDAVTMQFTASVGAVATMSLMLAVGAAGGWPVLQWRPVDGPAWAWLALMGLLATVAHVLIVQAFRRASAVVLAPLQYLELGAAVFWGWLVFGDWPELWTWLGMGVIVASGLYVFHRERRRALDRTETAATAQP